MCGCECTGCSSKCLGVWVSVCVCVRGEGEVLASVRVCECRRTTAVSVGVDVGKGVGVGVNVGVKYAKLEKNTPPCSRTAAAPQPHGSRTAVETSPIRA